MKFELSVATKRPSTGRLIAGNLLVFVIVLALVEGAARVYIRITRGPATAGLQARTLNLEYEPYVMFGPGWDHTFATFPKDDTKPVVLLVGGSTAQGFAAEILESAIAARFGRPVRVLNAAFGGYEARQEVVVASLWGPT